MFYSHSYIFPQTVQCISHLLFRCCMCVCRMLLKYYLLTYLPDSCGSESIASAHWLRAPGPRAYKQARPRAGRPGGRLPACRPGARLRGVAWAGWLHACAMILRRSPLHCGASNHVGGRLLVCLCRNSPLSGTSEQQRLDRRVCAVVFVIVNVPYRLRTVVDATVTSR